MAKKERIGAHGLTETQALEIKLRQESGDIEMIPANRLASLADRYFKDDYKNHQIAMHERNMYHVAMELRSHNSGTGERESVPNIQIFDEAAWTNFKMSDVFKSYTSEIIHNPELEEKDAPLVTLEYTLDERESRAPQMSITDKAAAEALRKAQEENEELKKQLAARDIGSYSGATPDPILSPVLTPTPVNPSTPPLGEELTEQKIEDMYEIKEAKALLKELTDKPVPNHWTLEKTKEEIKRFLGFIA